MRTFPNGTGTCSSKNVPERPLWPSRSSGVGILSLHMGNSFTWKRHFWLIKHQVGSPSTQEFLSEIRQVVASNSHVMFRWGCHELISKTSRKEGPGHCQDGKSRERILLEALLGPTEGREVITDHRMILGRDPQGHQIPE